MKEIVIFCQAYDQIECTIYLAMRNCQNAAITIVIPNKPHLLKAIEVINERVFHNSINIVYFEFYQRQPLTGNKIKKALCLLSSIVKERQYLKAIFNKYFAEFTGVEVFFFNRHYSTGTFYLLKKLGKANRLVYMPSSYFQYQIDKDAPTNRIELVNLIRWKLVYGFDVVMCKLPYRRGIACMPDKFMEKEVDKVIDIAERDEMMKGFDLSQFRIFDAGNYSVMYFSQNLFGAGYIPDRDTFRRELTEIFNIVGKYFPNNEIAIKGAPRREQDVIVTTGEVLPDFIPAEFLFNENVKMYLGVFSAALANVKKGLAVSLMDLVTFKDNRIKEQVKEVLIQNSRSKILFPQSLDEFERILINIKQQTNA